VSKDVQFGFLVVGILTRTLMEVLVICQKIKIKIICRLDESFYGFPRIVHSPTNLRNS
jgi:hypothetical protein